MGLIDEIRLVNKGLNNRFPDGRGPFKMTTRLAEECGELAKEVNHFEATGVKIEKHGKPDKTKLAKEVQDVIRAALQICSYYEVDKELEESVKNSLEKLRKDGYV